jgi:hypothetical protein
MHQLAVRAPFPLQVLVLVQGLVQVLAVLRLEQFLAPNRLPSYDISERFLSHLHFRVNVRVRANCRHSVHRFG